jgi:hypothetical protein
MKAIQITNIYLCALLLAGCLPDTSGVNPPDDSFFYPVGLTVTHTNDHLLVVNSNFDLTYNAGTLVDVPLKNIFDESGEILSSKKSVSYLRDNLSKDRQFLYLAEDEIINSKETIRVGSFASDLELTPFGHRAIIPVRGERAVIIVDVNESTSDKSKGLLYCGENDDKECDDSHRVQSNDTVSLPIEPYEVSSATYKETSGNYITLGFATHLAGGEVSVFQIDDYSMDPRQSNGRGTLNAELLSVANDIVPGASGIAVRLDNENLTGHEIYVSGRHDPSPRVAVLRVLTDSNNGSRTNDPYFGEVSKFSFGKDIYGGTDARGLAVTSAGDAAFLVTRSPEALLMFDTETREMTDMTTLGTDPSVVGLFEDDDEAVYAFVLCFASSQVYVVEPDMMRVQVRSTGSGPHAITFDKKRKLAFIANFRESTITVIHAVPPFDHVMIEVEDPDDSEIMIMPRVMIGRPRLPESHS